MKPPFKLLLVSVVLGCQALPAQTHDTNNVIVQNFVGSAFYGLVDGQGELTMFDHPGSVVADSGGNLFVMDQNNNVIREVTTNGVVTTFAGGGQGNLPGYGTNVSFGWLAPTPGYRFMG